MIKTYDQCVKAILVQIERYKTARRSNEWDKREFTNIRANMSESLLDFAPIYSSLRSAAEQAKLNLKLFEIERKKYWKEQITGRGSVGRFMLT